MKRLLIIVLSVALLGACARSPESDRRGAGDGSDEGGHLALEVDPTELRHAVDRINTNYVDALLTGNAKLFSECFTENGAVLLPDGRVVQGRDSIYFALRPFFQRMRVLDGSLTTQNLYIVDENAFEVGRWRGSIGPIAATRAPADSGEYTRIWKRDDRREWKIWRDVVRSSA